MMTIPRLETQNKHCHKCKWCSKYDDYNVLADTHIPIYYCVVGDFYSKKKPDMVPTLKNNCACFIERYKDDDEGEA